MNNFYLDCLQDFQEEAKKYGVMSKGVITVPELVPYGENYAKRSLDDPFFKLQFVSTPQVFYYVIMSLTMQAGMAYAVKWHENFSELDAYAETILADGPADTAIALMNDHFPAIAANQGNAFFQAIFARWLAKVEPYMVLPDPREYYLSATLAAYQIGVSMMLERLGY